MPSLNIDVCHDFSICQLSIMHVHASAVCYMLDACKLTVASPGKGNYHTSTRTMCATVGTVRCIAIALGASLPAMLAQRIRNTSLRQNHHCHPFKAATHRTFCQHGPYSLRPAVVGDGGAGAQPSCTTRKHKARGDFR